MTEKLERGSTIRGSYDGTSHPRNFGIHGMELVFWVKGSKGAITIRIFTNWWLPHLQDKMLKLATKGYPFDPLVELMGPKIVDISYHAKEPQYDEQYSIDNCEFTDGKCYCGGSSLWGDEWLPGFLHGGSEWLFERMKDEYRHRFEGGPPIDLTPIPRTFGD